ncbi:porin [Pseudomonas syringae pv. syringae PD2774]|uniref:carbohydrate porin n=1 Tax=Pseudomonas syringae TaxID=317 RepID=UPI00073744A2|nr:carbohydrate porin [Pseudomonas syringae]KTB79613.1 porin [Pseudomonas syringae pv. syringae PD2774]
MKTASKKLAVGFSLPLLCTSALAAEPTGLQLAQRSLQVLPSSIDKSSPNQRTGPRVLFAEPHQPARDDRPMVDQGRWLKERGISPHLGMTELYMRNPSTGLKTGNQSSVTFFDIGADFDMQRLAGINGGIVHFQQLYVPWVSNLDYGAQVGDPLLGEPNPYVPKTRHLSLLTYEQRLLDDQLTVEVGKSNAGNYFALPLCNVPLGCVNVILQDAAAFNPPPYANWGARVAYDFSPQWRAQIGAWRSNNAYPFTNGWERSAGDSGGTLSTSYLADLAYRTDYGNSTYPTSVELLGFHNNGTQLDPYYTVEGTARASSSAAPRTSDGITGAYLGAKQTLWRADGGLGKDMNPTAVSAYVAYSHLFDSNAGSGQSNGISRQANTGLILSAPFRSRPFDSYSMHMNWVHQTADSQRYLEEAHALSNPGSTYRPDADEFTLNLDANIVLGDSIILSPYIARSFNASSKLNPYATESPNDGLAMGLLVRVQIDQLLGLGGL